MLHDRASRTAFLVALLAHALVILPVWEGFVPGRAGGTPPASEDEPLRFTFVDPPDAPVAAPEEPTPLLSSEDHRAAQPEPLERPRGEAYQAGRTPVPQRPRAAGSASPGAAPTPSEAPPAAARAEATQAATDRLAEAGRQPAAPSGGPLRPGIASALRPGSAPAPGDRLPAPETDQRRTAARAGATYSLNTTAWEYGPYMERLKRRIEEHIFPPPAFYYGMAAWVTRVRFRIAPDGRLEGLEMLDHEGVRNLQYVAISAVEGAADFEPLPPGFPEPYLEITGGFYFNASPAGR
ncbi:MAG TPA: hypothetical protein VFP76_01610 [Gemmatimonadota bacterium]|nr:hypothetical protein [Gemmatimonadota bacterium]